MFAPFFLLAASQENQLVQAIKYFDQNNFQEAEKILGELIIEKPDNLMINYFYGACRTENRHYGQKEVLYLLKGSVGESPLKTDYYLAVQYHAQNRWDDALLYYKMFKVECTDEEAIELKLAEKIQQCTNKINPFVNSEDENEINEDVAPAPIERPEGDTIAVYANTVYPEADTISTVSITQEDSTVLDSLPLISPPEQASPEKTKPKPQPEPIEFAINGQLTYIDTSNFRTNEGLEAFLGWRESQQKLDSLISEIDHCRSEYAEAKTTSRRNELGQNILEAENSQLALQKQSKQLLNTARSAESNYWNSMQEDELLAFSNEISKQATVLKDEKEETQSTIDTLVIPVEVFEDIAPVAPPVSQEENSDDLIYKIQIGAYSRGLPNYVKKQFDKLSYIRKIENYTDERGVVVYTTGNLTNLEDAVKMQNQVRQEGIEDAFVVPYFNGKRITLSEAKKLEQGR